jgi:hypothetical protein
VHAIRGSKTYYALLSVYSMKTQINIGNSLFPDQNGNEALHAALKLANCALPLKVSLAASYGMHLPF